MGIEAKPIGELLPAMTDRSTASPNAVELRFSDLDLTVLHRLPARLSDALMIQLELIANCPLPAEDAAEEDHFAKVMHTFATALKKRADDNLDGDLRYAIYRKKLGKLPQQALSYLCDKALDKFTFFPTIAECMQILEGYDGRASAKLARDQAANALRHERQARMEETMLQLMKGELDGEAIAALPDGIREIALTRALIWDDGDGKYRPRPDLDAAAMRERSQRNLV